MGKSHWSNRFQAVAVVAAVFALTFLECAAASGAEKSGGAGVAAAFALRRQGVPAGGCYYDNAVMIAGDFSKDRGDEILTVDTDGYAHILKWAGAGFEELWVSRVWKEVIGAAAADLDGDRLDMAVFLGRDGKLTVWGDEREHFKVMCDGCYGDAGLGPGARAIAARDADGDGKQELVVVRSAKGKSELVELKWSGRGLEILAVKPIDLKSSPEKLFVSGADDFDLFLYSVRSGKAELIKVREDEEGAALEEPVRLARYGSVIDGLSLSMLPGAGDPAIVFLDYTKNGSRRLRAADPFSEKTGDLFSFSPVPPDTRFAVAADLNGDAAAEIVLATARDCLYSVFSRAAFRLFVNGKEIERPQERVRRGKANKIFVDASLFAGYKLQQDSKSATISGGGRKLVFRFAEKKSMISIEESDELAEIEMPFIFEGGKLYLEAGPAARYLDYDMKLDYITDTLRLKKKSEDSK